MSDPKKKRQLTNVALSDAVNEALNAFGVTPEQMLLILGLIARERETTQERKRAAYKTAHPFELLSDKLIDSRIAAEENASTPLLSQRNIVWSYPDELRRMLGYYTNEERELAARLNDIRSNSFLGNVMPNFGRAAAYANPEGEMNAFRETAYYAPNMTMMGAGYGLPSVSRAVMTGVRQGWNTAGNIGTRVWNAVSQGAKGATSTGSGKRWLITTAAGATPFTAAAANNDYSGFIWGATTTIPLYLGGRWVVRKIKSSPSSTTTASSYTYKPDRRLFTWENPKAWEKSSRKAAQDKISADLVEEWNRAVGDPAKEKAFIEKYKIRSTYGLTEWVDVEQQRPKTYTVLKTEKVKEPIMEKITDLNGNVLESPVRDKEGNIVYLDVEREVLDLYGNPVTYEKLVLDENGNPVIENYIMQEDKLDANGNPVITYPPIENDNVRKFLQKRGLDGYTSDIQFDPTSKYIFTGPRKSLIGWSTARNLGRGALGLFGAFTLGGLGHGIYSAIKSDNKPSAKTDDKAAATDTVSSDTTVVVENPGYDRNANFTTGSIFGSGIPTTANDTVPQR